MATVFIVTVVLLSACSRSGAEDRDWAAETEEQLLADGVEVGIAGCVLNLGRRELERGPLSDAAADELLRNCLAAVQVIEAADATPQLDLALTDAPWTFGDDPELDRLWTACDDGLGAACDQLFEQSPIDSQYEDFGVSCGGRQELLNCSELDAPQEPAQ